MASTFRHGVEQELQLVDPRQGALRRDVRDAVIDTLDSRRSSHAYAGFGPDGYPSQLEYWVGIARSLGELENLLTGFRHACVDACDAHGVAVLALGVNPLQRTDTDGENFGEHHHVGVASANEARRFHNLVRHFVPELIALSANSRWYGGSDSGQATLRLHRTHHCGLAPWLTPSMERDIVLASKTPFGGGLRRFWDVTPFVKWGRTTVEVRLFDVRPAIRATVGTAALLQALLHKLRSGVDALADTSPGAEAERELVANRTAAIEHGLVAGFSRRFHPVFRRRNRVTARKAIDDLASWLRSDLSAVDSQAWRFVEAAIEDAESTQSEIASASEVLASGLDRTRQV